MIALNHHAAIVRKARKDRHRGVWVKLVSAIEFRDTVCAFGKAFDDHIRIEAKDLANGDVFSWFHVDVQHLVGHGVCPCLVRAAQPYLMINSCLKSDPRTRGRAAKFKPCSKSFY